MKTTSHTPGPWKIGIPHDRETARIVVDINGSTIEIAKTGTYGVRAAEEVPNARLIAAAPDLLEALKDCLQFAELGNAAEAARAAIKKAVPDA